MFSEIRAADSASVRPFASVRGRVHPLLRRAREKVAFRISDPPAPALALPHALSFSPPPSLLPPLLPH